MVNEIAGQPWSLLPGTKPITGASETFATGSTGGQKPTLTLKAEEAASQGDGHGRNGAGTDAAKRMGGLLVSRRGGLTDIDRPRKGVAMIDEGEIGDTGLVSRYN